MPSVCLCTDCFQPVGGGASQTDISAEQKNSMFMNDILTPLTFTSKNTVCSWKMENDHMHTFLPSIS